MNLRNDDEDVFSIENDPSEEEAGVPSEVPAPKAKPKPAARTNDMEIFTGFKLPELQPPPSHLTFPLFYNPGFNMGVHSTTTTNLSHSSTLAPSHSLGKGSLSPLEPVSVASTATTPCSVPTICASIGSLDSFQASEAKVMTTPALTLESTSTTSSILPKKDAPEAKSSSVPTTSEHGESQQETKTPMQSSFAHMILHPGDVVPLNITTTKRNASPDVQSFNKRSSLSRDSVSLPNLFRRRQKSNSRSLSRERKAPSVPLVASQQQQPWPNERWAWLAVQWHTNPPLALLQAWQKRCVQMSVEEQTKWEPYLWDPLMEAFLLLQLVESRLLLADLPKEETIPPGFRLQESKKTEKPPSEMKILLNHIETLLPLWKAVLEKILTSDLVPSLPPPLSPPRLRVLETNTKETTIPVQTPFSWRRKCGHCCLDFWKLVWLILVMTVSGLYIVLMLDVSRR